jgi:hypothetical protein
MAAISFAVNTRNALFRADSSEWPRTRAPGILISGSWAKWLR